MFVSYFRQFSAVTLLLTVQCCSSTLVDARFSASVTPRFQPPTCDSSQGIADTRVRIQYREVGRNGDLGDWIPQTFFALGASQTTQRTITGLNTSIVDGLQFRALQLEHGGGPCSCWSLTALTVALDNMPAGYE